MARKKKEPVIEMKKEINPGFEWRRGKYSSAFLYLAGLKVGETHWTYIKDDPKPNKGSMILCGFSEELESASEEDLRSMIMQKVVGRVNRLKKGLTFYFEESKVSDVVDSEDKERQDKDGSIK